MLFSSASHRIIIKASPSHQSFSNPLSDSGNAFYIYEKKCCDQSMAEDCRVKVHKGAQEILLPIKMQVH